MTSRKSGVHRSRARADPLSEERKENYEYCDTEDCECWNHLSECSLIFGNCRSHEFSSEQCYRNSGNLSTLSARVLKNAIDCASRPYGDNAFDGKPVAVMGASIGTIGTARAQYHLRQSFVFLNMYPINKPEVIISFAKEKFDDKGNLKDEHTKENIKELLVALVEWAQKLRQ